MRKPAIIIYILIGIYLIIFVSGCKAEKMKYSVEASTRLTRQVDHINKLQLYNGVGDIKVVSYDGDTVFIDLKKTFRGDDQKELLALSKGIEIKTTESGGTLTINTVYKHNDIWKWKPNNKDDICMDYTLKVPRKVTLYAFKSAVGDIKLENLAGQMEVASDVGDIHAANISIQNDSKFNSGIGDIHLSISGIIATAKVDVRNDVGDIHFSIPKKIPGRLKIHEYMENPKTIGDKGPLVTLQADLGDISVVQQ